MYQTEEQIRVQQGVSFMPGTAEPYWSQKVMEQAAQLPYSTPDTAN